MLLFLVEVKILRMESVTLSIITYSRRGHHIPIRGGTWSHRGMESQTTSFQEKMPVGPIIMQHSNVFLKREVCLSSTAVPVCEDDRDLGWLT